jgi:lysine 2,3-aminomutase
MDSKKQIKSNANVDQKRVFYEKLSPFLQKKLKYLLAEYGSLHDNYLGILRQYKMLPEENIQTPEINRRHYDADISICETGGVKGVERLYRRTVVIELTMSCVAHCRYCLRQKYDLYTLTEQDIEMVARYCGSKQLKDEVNEVLVTGGDPFLVPKSLAYLVELLMQYAPNVKIIRVATRLPQQDPSRVSDAVLDVFRNKPGIRFEIATQTNHSIEFFPEVRDCFLRIREVVSVIYSQNVLLKGVNDNRQSLLDLYEAMRSLGIQAHYLFHAVPMQGLHHFRTTVDKGLKLAREITSCGIFSGRAKPIFALMTDIGKIVLYEGSIIKQDKITNRILFRSGYRLDERLKWNPSWKMPATAVLDKDGYLDVWYLDGND